MIRLDEAAACGRRWADEAIRRIEADFRRSADTHLVPVPLPAFPGVDLYLKDESSHPTGSLKHRLARSLFLYALCNGRIGPGTTIVEASSGSTAVSEAYFARLLELPFVAVVPRSTSVEKLAAIASHGGRVHVVERPEQAYEDASRLARELGGVHLDQFTFAERATDWRGNNNIADSIFAQMALERHPVPTWIVCGAGTGGTSATIGRFVRYRRLETRVCLADPLGSVFHRHWKDRRVERLPACDSRIEGIGRARVEPSFVPDVIDRAEAVADVESFAAARVLSAILGRRCGGSTGTNFRVCCKLAGELATAGRTASIVSILCDDGDRYASTLFDDGWLESNGLDLSPSTALLEEEISASAIARRAGT